MGPEPSFDTIDASLKTAKDSWRRFAGFARFLPGVSEYAGFGGRALFLLVRDQIVCVDDLERAGSQLGAKEVLGLLSFLKEQRNCKVVLLLNEEALLGENAADFRSQLEKVADTIVHLDPTPIEAATIGISDKNPRKRKILASCVSIGIVNIRTIKKVERHCDRAIELLADLDERVMDQAIQSIVLFSYCRYQPDKAPPLDFVGTFNIYDGLMEGKGDDPYADARALLGTYNFSGVDSFDRILLEGIQQGGFDEGKVRAEAEALHNKLMLQDKDASFKNAWDLYHNSFDDNADAVMDALASSLRNNVEIVSPSGLDATVRLFKDLGRKAEAAEIVNYYVEHRQDPAIFWDLGHYSFSENVKDTDVVEAFATKLATFPEEGGPLESLYNIGSSDGWSGTDTERVSRLSVMDFYDIFKRLRGADQRRALRGALSFKRVGNADEKMKAVVAKAEAALARIAAESPINARRIGMKYGIVASTEPEAGEEGADASKAD
jgi:hypothetical protein